MGQPGRARREQDQREPNEHKESVAEVAAPRAKQEGGVLAEVLWVAQVRDAEVYVRVPVRRCTELQRARGDGGVVPLTVPVGARSVPSVLNLRSGRNEPGIGGALDPKPAHADSYEQ